ncbi:MAG: hypothetical protein JKY34_00410 [Kordiimonadaceae bacterium]|nr:hypothetical protein [Kordiimonadaceae bacterium]
MSENMTPPKLPVIEIVKEALQGAYFHFNDMVRIVWLPTLLYVVLNVYISQQTAGALEPTLLLVVAFIALFILSAMMAVAWHRRILTGEAPTELATFRFGRPEARYVLITIMLGVLLLPGIFFIVMSGGLPGDNIQSMMAGIGPTGQPENGSITYKILGNVLLLVGFHFSVRLSLLLPAVAIGESVNAGQVINMTKGNFWRLLGTMLLSSLIIFIGVGIVKAVVESLLLAIGLGAAEVILIINIIISLLTIFALVVNVAVLSIAYRRLSQDAGTRA